MKELFDVKIDYLIKILSNHIKNYYINDLNKILLNENINKHYSLNIEYFKFYIVHNYY